MLRHMKYSNQGTMARFFAVGFRSWYRKRMQPACIFRRHRAGVVVDLRSIHRQRHLVVFFNLR